MKKFFRAICFCLVALCFGALVACKKPEEPNSNAQNPSDGQTQAPEEGGSGQNPSSATLPEDTSRIKNVIVMIGDGMGPVHEEAARIRKGAPLAWDDFSYTGYAHTRSLTTRENTATPTDSAAAATALATGVKVYNSTVSRSTGGDELRTILDYAHDAGKSTGVVTSDALCGATPAGFSGHASDRNDSANIISTQATGTVDILLGADEDSKYANRRGDFTSRGYYYTSNAGDLTAERYSSRVIGAFPSIDAKENNEGSVRLKSLVSYALDYLSRDEDGFCLMIEGAKIDKKSHASEFEKMVYELLDFDECVQYVKEFMKNRNDTYVLVTADHETGGLQLKNAVNKSNLFRPSSYTWTTPGVHSVADVHYYAQGANSLHHVSVIENTTVFRIAQEFVTKTPSPEPDVVESEIRLGKNIYTPQSLPEQITLGGGTVRFAYDKDAKVIDMTLNCVDCTGADYLLYVWNQDMRIHLVGVNAFTRTSGRCVLGMGNSNITFCGSGSLTINRDLYLVGNLTVESGNVHVGSGGYYDAVTVSGEVNVSGGKLSAIAGNESTVAGVKCDGFNLYDGEVVLSNFKYAIYTLGNVNIMGGTLKLKDFLEAGLYSDVLVTAVINAGTVEMNGTGQGIKFNNSQLECRVDVYKNAVENKAEPVITINTTAGGIRASKFDMFGGTLNITTGGADAIKFYDYMYVGGGTINLTRQDNAHANNGIYVSANSGLYINKGTLNIQGFEYGIRVSPDNASYHRETSTSTLNYINCTHNRETI